MVSFQRRRRIVIVVDSLPIVKETIIFSLTNLPVEYMAHVCTSVSLHKQTEHRSGSTAKCITAARTQGKVFCPHSPNPLGASSLDINRLTQLINRKSMKLIFSVATTPGVGLHAIMCERTG